MNTPVKQIPTMAEIEAARRELSYLSQAELISTVSDARAYLAAVERNFVSNTCSLMRELMPSEPEASISARVQAIMLLARSGV